MNSSLDLVLEVEGRISVDRSLVLVLCIGGFLVLLDGRR
jgi:hypothetical protein